RLRRASYLNSVSSGSDRDLRGCSGFTSLVASVQRFRNSNHVALLVGWAKSPGSADVTTLSATRFCPRRPTKRVPTAWAKARTALINAVSRAKAPLPTLVVARISIVGTFRKERSGPGGHPGRTADRRIVAHLSLWGCVRSRIAIGSSLGPGWLKEPRVRITRKGRGR